jgi:hypothetical protein
MERCPPKYGRMCIESVITNSLMERCPLSIEGCGGASVICVPCKRCRRRRRVSMRTISWDQTGDHEAGWCTGYKACNSATPGRFPYPSPQQISVEVCRRTMPLCTRRCPVSLDSRNLQLPLWVDRDSRCSPGEPSSFSQLLPSSLCATILCLKCCYVTVANLGGLCVATVFSTPAGGKKTQSWAQAAGSRSIHPSESTQVERWSISNTVSTLGHDFRSLQQWTIKDCWSNIMQSKSILCSHKLLLQFFLASDQNLPRACTRSGFNVYNIPADFGWISTRADLQASLPYYYCT